MKSIISSSLNNSPNLSDSNSNGSTFKSNKSENINNTNMNTNMNTNTNNSSSNKSIIYDYKKTTSYNSNSSSNQSSSQKNKKKLRKRNDNNSKDNNSKDNNSKDGSRNHFEYSDSHQVVNNLKITKKMRSHMNSNNSSSSNSMDSNIPLPDSNSNMVFLNIYDLDSLSRVVNSFAKSIGTGAFHAGVEVYGNEYCFGFIQDGETGITKTIARQHPYHVYRESIYMGNTPLTKEEVNLLVDVMKLQWIGDTYDLLSRNCLNFADYFCNLLDVGGVPEWVMSLQKKITWVKSNINVATTKLKALNKASGIPNFLKYIQKKYKDENDSSDEYQQGCKVLLKS